MCFCPLLFVAAGLRWDGSVTSADFVVGYEDRFIGIMERPFDAFTWADLSTLAQTVTAIPRHRIVYFMYRGRIVWDKRNRTDDVYGSTGGLTLEEVVEEVAGALAARSYHAVLLNECTRCLVQQHCQLQLQFWPVLPACPGSCTATVVRCPNLNLIPHRDVCACGTLANARTAHAPALRHCCSRLCCLVSACRGRVKAGRGRGGRSREGSGVGCEDTQGKGEKVARRSSGIR